MPFFYTEFIGDSEKIENRPAFAKSEYKIKRHSFFLVTLYGVSRLNDFVSQLWLLVRCEAQIKTHVCSQSVTNTVSVQLHSFKALLPHFPSSFLLSTLLRPVCLSVHSSPAVLFTPQWLCHLCFRHIVNFWETWIANNKIQNLTFIILSFTVKFPQGAKWLSPLSTKVLCVGDRPTRVEWRPSDHEINAYQSYIIMLKGYVTHNSPSIVNVTKMHSFL